jgi:hypothetical protein
MPVFAPGGQVVKEVYGQPAYSSTFLTNTQAAAATLFSNVVGQGGLTYLDTNMRVSGMLPSGQSMLVKIIRVIPQYNPLPADLINVMNNCFLTLYVGDKPYLYLPLAFIPAASGIFGFNVGNAASSISHGTPDSRSNYVLAEPIEIPNMQTFRVEIQPVAPLAINTQGGLRIWVMLDGPLARDVQ